MIVAIIAIAITFTGPSLIQNTRIGLEFKGGYEILYKVESLQMFSLAIFVGLLTGTFVSICVDPSIWSYLIPSRTHQRNL